MCRMNHKSAIFITISMIVLIITFVVGCTKKEEKELKIGVVLSLTGRGATYGERALRGMQLAVHELNRTGRFKKKPLVLIVEDSNSSAQQSLSAFRKLIELNHVPVAVGFVLSDEVLTCAPLANEKKVVLLTTAAGSDEIKNAGEYVFRNRESASFQTEAIANACVQKFGFKEVAILHSNSANGLSYARNFQSAIEGLGGKVTISVPYNEGSTDYRAEIAKLRSKKPKAVYLAGLDNELGIVLKQSKETGFKPQFFASPGAISQKLLEIAKNGAEGLVCGSAPFNVESDDPHVHAFTSAFKERFSESPDFIAANSYDAIYMISDLFKKDAKNGEQIKKGLYAIKDYPGVGGITTFDSFGEVIKPITLVQIKNGRFVPLEDK